MCGLTGFIRKRGFHADQLEFLRLATECLSHRGPDDFGIWYDQAAGIALGHRRLSILDLSPTGHQPMHSSSGRYVIVFNGEIYNFLSIRKELDSLSPHDWRGQSDTEVMLFAIEHWGIDAALKRFVGMFAFALWDRQEHSLTLVRDRIGEKPLYYGWCGDVFLFGSELKALRAYPAFHADIDRNAVALYLRHNCIPAPYTIHKGIRKLIPGTTITITDAAGEGQYPESATYWSARTVAEHGLESPFAGTEEELADVLETLLRDAVGKQMIADVPLGALFSGGIDSSTIVALMQAQSTRPVKTFTIGFTEEAYNETMDARAVARHLGTDHTELYISPKDAMAVIPRLPILYDEPFADSSQIPTFLVSQLARRYVTVGLTGDAGDELFGGYNRHFWWQRIWRKLRWFPQPVRKYAAKAIETVSPRTWDWIFNAARLILPDSFKQRTPGDKLHKLASILDARDPMEMYWRFISHWQKPAYLVLGAEEPATSVSTPAQWLNTGDITAQMMYLDLVTYLPDDILTKLDRATMGVSLESRVPFVDHRVVEFIWGVPLSMKVRSGQSKWLLRQILNRYVPKELTDRPKAGFGVPIGSWIRGPLRDWAEALLDKQRLQKESFFNPGPIRDMWRDHLTGNHNWQYHLWDVLMFQAWLEAQ